MSGSRATHEQMREGLISEDTKTRSVSSVKLLQKQLAIKRVSESVNIAVFATNTTVCMYMVLKISPMG